MSYHSTHKLCAGVGGVITGAAITVSMFLCTLPVGFIQPSYAFGAETSTAERSTAGTTASAISGTTITCQQLMGMMAIRERTHRIHGKRSTRQMPSLHSSNQAMQFCSSADRYSTTKACALRTRREASKRRLLLARMAIQVLQSRLSPQTELRPVIGSKITADTWEITKTTERCPRLFCCAMSRISS